MATQPVREAVTTQSLLRRSALGRTSMKKAFAAPALHSSACSSTAGDSPLTLLGINTEWRCSIGQPNPKRWAAMHVLMK